MAPTTEPEKVVNLAGFIVHSLASLIALVFALVSYYYAIYMNWTYKAETAQQLGFSGWVMAGIHEGMAGFHKAVQDGDVSSRPANVYINVSAICCLLLVVWHILAMAKKDWLSKPWAYMANWTWVISVLLTAVFWYTWPDWKNGAACVWTVIAVIEVAVQGLLTWATFDPSRVYMHPWVEPSKKPTVSV